MKCRICQEVLDDNDYEDICFICFQAKMNPDGEIKSDKELKQRVQGKK